MLVGIGCIVLGVVLIFWAFSGQPIKEVPEVRAKVRLLLSNGFSGPDDYGRPFFAGIVSLIIGLFYLAFNRHLWW
jgi:hypothetical protein